MFYMLLIVGLLNPMVIETKIKYKCIRKEIVYFQQYRKHYNKNWKQRERISNQLISTKPEGGQIYMNVVSVLSSKNSTYIKI